MNTEFWSEASLLSDRELLERVKLLAGSECRIIARLMAHLSGEHAGSSGRRE
jgi:hypothetical protein